MKRRKFFNTAASFVAGCALALALGRESEYKDEPNPDYLLTASEVSWLYVAGDNPWKQIIIPTCQAPDQLQPPS